LSNSSRDFADECQKINLLKILEKVEISLRYIARSISAGVSRERRYISVKRNSR